MTGTSYDENIDQIAIENQIWQSKGLTPPAEGTAAQSTREGR